MTFNNASRFESACDHALTKKSLCTANCALARHVDSHGVLPEKATDSVILLQETLSASIFPFSTCGHTGSRRR